MISIDLNEFKYWFFTKRLSKENLASKYKCSIEDIENYIQENSLKRKEYKDGNSITREELHEWYIVKDGSYLDAPDYFGISRWKFEDLCRKYNIKKDRKKTCLKSVKTREEKAGGKQAYNQQLDAVRKQNMVINYGSIENFKKSVSDSCKKTWEKEHETILNHIYKVKKENNSFNSSTPEENFYISLLNLYSENDIIRQYKDERYPFSCDFYIKSKDLFIELNLMWTHGFHFFDENNPEDILLLKNWKLKAEKSDFYRNAIHTWTELDVSKRYYAIKNNLNYLVFFNLVEMETWLNEQKH